MGARTVVVQQLLDQINVREQHAAAAVSIQLQIIQRLSFVHVRLKQRAVLVPLVADHLRKASSFN
eukprot:SAG11_NODE_2948_length_2818_cov_1.988599_1_plen_65_part_00